MIIEPRTRGFICLTAHPEGCEKNVQNQIDYIKAQPKNNGPKRVLVLGASTGFGLASRITSAFGSDAATIGVFFEKPPKEGKTASPGWYNSAAFEKAAHAANLYAKSVNGDAFSKEIKQQTIDLIKTDLGQVDLIIYSVAAPMRVHPDTGVRHKSVLKPIGGVFSNKTVDFHTAKVSEVSIQPAIPEDIQNTVAVMGGEDWKMWMDAMMQAGVLAEGATTVAYSYIGPEVTHAVYRNGTIGMAKNDLEKSAFEITESLQSISAKAYVSVNKALVTQASSAIPVIPLYISLLFKIMKEKELHEGCIEQMHRLYADRLYSGQDVPLDDEGRIRVDDWEMRPDVQEAVAGLWDQANSENIETLGDLSGYKKDFFQLFGFELEGVVYGKESDEMVWIPSIVKS
ncbi:MAG: trans-2-enoyl-CoA reductase family protein [Flavobacteriaceae bacterium]|nr:trans-2-enoyl-CoA reductase family protein [Flavobacteriaceae bacterium]